MAKGSHHDAWICGFKHFEDRVCGPHRQQVQLHSSFEIHGLSVCFARFVLHSVLMRASASIMNSAAHEAERQYGESKLLKDAKSGLKNLNI